MEIVSLIQVKVDGYIPHIFLNTWFIVAKEYVSVNIPYPDYNPEESLIVIFYEGTGNAEFVFESYMTRLTLLFPASFDDMPIYSEKESIPLNGIGLLAIPILLRKRKER